MDEYKVADIVLIYRGTPTFEEGNVGQIIDRDPDNNDYLVAPLRDIGKVDGDINKILQRYGKWVKPENMTKLEFDKPKLAWYKRIFK